MFVAQKKQSTLLENNWIQNKQKEIENHVAWHGKITGMLCEALLRDQSPFTYLLRAGEEELHYYLSFVQAPVTFKHQPFIIEFSVKGWFYRNGYTGIAPTVEEIIPMIMHCSPEECHPLIPKNLGSGLKFNP